MWGLFSFSCVPLVQFCRAMVDLKQVFMLNASHLLLPFGMAGVGSQQVLEGEVISVI